MRAKLAVTMEAVARLAGVSRSTVSRALQNDARLTAATCERVRQAAEKLGYRPNPFVRTLMADLKRRRAPQSTSTLAFITAFGSRDGWMRHNPSFLQYFEGARERAAEQGFRLEAFWLKDPRLTEDRFNRMLITRNIRGLILPPLPRPLGGLTLAWEHFSSVAIGYTLLQPDLTRAVANFYQGMRLALQELIPMGFQRIGFVTDASADQRVQHAWLAAYLVYQQGLPAARRLPALISRDARGAALKTWLRDERPDAIIGAHNGIHTWLQQSGSARSAKPPFFSLNTGRDPNDPPGVNQQSRLVGASAVDLLIGQLHRNEYDLPQQPTTTLIPGVWSKGAGTVKI